MVPQEVALRDRLSELPELQRLILANASAVEQLTQQNAAYYRQRLQIEQRLQSIAGGRAPRRIGNGSGSARKEVEELQEQLETLCRRCVPPDEVGGVPAVRREIIRWIRHRDRLFLTLTGIRDGVGRLDEWYGPLREDAGVQQALTAIGPSERLGPARNYQRDIKSLEKYEALVYTSEVPLYRQVNRHRVGAIVNEQVPATFTWAESNEPTIVTTSLAQATGTQIAADAPRYRLRIGNRRKLIVRETTLPYVRFGKFAIANVKALVLPPEGEDLGSQIGQAALEGYEAKPFPAQCKLVISPKPEN